MVKQSVYSISLSSNLIDTLVCDLKLALKSTRATYSFHETVDGLQLVVLCAASAMDDFDQEQLDLDLTDTIKMYRTATYSVERS